LFKAPPWTGLLRTSTDFCDPLHLNYIHRVGSDAGPGLSPGDIVLSLRNISRFAILDGQTWTLKRVVAGSFVHQHAVHHVAGSRFVMFDNMGGSPAGPATRILEVDVETGQERLIFPNETIPDEFQDLFSETAGNLHLSADRSRLLASFTEEGLAFEIDYPTGKLLASYRHLHDLSQLNRTPEGEPSAALFRIFTLRYVDTDKTLLEAKKQ
ncbi:MAG: arylsulfotransferase family protein, partial [Alphaproteobacteria bacterium]|nr:arylsulfotransferase family protein [Alphaproteobacteria bacterium]